jgi:hypothetical protein
MSRVIGFLVTITNAQEKPTVRCRVFGEKVKWGDDMKNWDRDVEQDHDFLCWVNRRLLKRYIFSLLPDANRRLCAGQQTL